MIIPKIGVKILRKYRAEDLELAINEFIGVGLLLIGDDPLACQVLNLNYQVTEDTQERNYSCLISYRYGFEDGIERVEHLEPKSEEEMQEQQETVEDEQVDS